MKVKELSFEGVPYGTLSGLLTYRLVLSDDGEELSPKILLDRIKQDRKKITNGWGNLPLYIKDERSDSAINEMIELLEELEQFQISQIISETTYNSHFYINITHYRILTIRGKDFVRGPFFHEYLYSPEGDTLNLWEKEEESYFLTKSNDKVKRSLFLTSNFTAENYYDFVRQMSKKGITWNLISPMKKQYKRIIIEGQES